MLVRAELARALVPPGLDGWLGRRAIIASSPVWAKEGVRRRRVACAHSNNRTHRRAGPWKDACMGPGPRPRHGRQTKPSPAQPSPAQPSQDRQDRQTDAGLADAVGQTDEGRCPDDGLCFFFVCFGTRLSMRLSSAPLACSCTLYPPSAPRQLASRGGGLASPDFSCPPHPRRKREGTARPCLGGCRGTLIRKKKKPSICVCVCANADGPPSPSRETGLATGQETGTGWRITLERETAAGPPSVRPAPRAESDAFVDR
jgi:hypothetical protein